MIVDTSVWIDHLRRGNKRLATLLAAAQVDCHPFVIGELACGNLTRRREILSLLRALPAAHLAEHNEVLNLVENHALMGRGIGWIDAHLLAAAIIAKTALWTLDRPLAEVSHQLGVGVPGKG